jgi:hypothetical protein
MTLAQTLQEIARALGGDVVGRQVICPGPGHSPKDRSLSVTPSASDADGFVVNSFANDDWRECRAHVLDRLRRPSAYEQGRAIESRTRQCSSEDRSARPRQLWDEAVDPRGTLVDTYLGRRALRLTSDVAGSVVRFHPRCPWRDDETETIVRKPTLVAAFRSIANPLIITAVHRTALSPAGEKLRRKMLGPSGDAAIMVDPDEAVTTGLVVGEGLETVLAARQLGWRPAWALGSAGAIAKFPVLSGIECITVLAELDDTGANARAIEAVGDRWLSAGREVLIVSPRFGGDANDALRSIAA